TQNPSEHPQSPVVIPGSQTQDPGRRNTPGPPPVYCTDATMPKPVWYPLSESHPATIRRRAPKTVFTPPRIHAQNAPPERRKERKDLTMTRPNPRSAFTSRAGRLATASALAGLFALGS